MFPLFVPAAAADFSSIKTWTQSRENWPRDSKTHVELELVIGLVTVVTRKLKPVTCKLGPVTCKLKPVICKLGPVTRKLGPVTRKLKRVTCKLGPVTV